MDQPDWPEAETAVRLPAPHALQIADLPAVLAAGWRDFRRAPAFGLIFSAFYVAGGLIFWWIAMASGQVWWMLPFVLGFPLLGPFAAAGLYEVSRRIEVSEPLDWPLVVKVVFAQKDRQLPAMAMVILILFMFWVIIAHTIFAVFMGPSAPSGLPGGMAGLWTGPGLGMLAVGSVAGAILAGVLFSITVAGLPLLLDHELDFVTAMIASVRAVRASPLAMIAWGALIAGLLFAAMLPLFVGLFVAIPVLGHASWHLYRRLYPARG